MKLHPRYNPCKEAFVLDTAACMQLLFSFSKKLNPTCINRSMCSICNVKNAFDAVWHGGLSINYRQWESQGELDIFFNSSMTTQLLSSMEW